MLRACNDLIELSFFYQTLILLNNHFTYQAIVREKVAYHQG